MALNVTTAVIGSGCNTATATPSLAQWDQGQVLKIEGVDLPVAYQVEFSTEYTRNAIPKIGNADGVAIPNELLQRSAPITAYIVLHEEENDRETEYWITIHIAPRTPPETITPDPEQMDVIDETIAALQQGVSDAEAAADAAESAANMLQNVSAQATTLDPGSEATAEYSDGVFYFGIPRGQNGGGGGGTGDYDDLTDKPQINSVELSGNKSLSDLGITKDGLGLGNVNNTSDADKPVSTAQQAALNNKLNLSGGTMSGAIDMNGSKVTGLASGTSPADAVNLEQVSSMISTNSAYFRGTFATKAALLAVAWQTSDPEAANYVSNNDFAIVLDDESQNDECWRYVYVSGSGWAAQYRINESPLTSAQLDALNSGATAALIGQITTNQTNIAGKITAPSSPSTGAFLVYNGSAWVAQSLSTWQGGNY